MNHPNFAKRCFRTSFEVSTLLAFALWGASALFSNHTHANTVHDKLKSVDAKPLQSAEGKTKYSAIYAICKNPSNSATTMYRVTNIRPHYRGNSKATLTLFNGYSQDIYLDYCQILKIA